MTDARPPETPAARDDVASVEALLGALVGQLDDEQAALWDDRTVAAVRARLERAEAQLLRAGVRETVARAASATAQAKATRQLLQRGWRYAETFRRSAPPADHDPDAPPARLALLARHAVPGTRWAGLRTTVGAAVSDPAFTEVEQHIAEAVGDGPASVDWPDLTAGDAPAGVRAAAARLGVCSVLGVPVAGGVVVLAGDRPHAFDDASRGLAARFAEHVDRRHPAAREARDAVGEATRVIARREGVGTDDAFDVLLETARRRGGTVVQVAQELERAPGGGPDGDRPAPAVNGGPTEPAVLRRALACIEERAAEDLGVTDIARAARIGVRGLQQIFRQYRDTTPLEYLRQVRLERAHSELEAADALAGDTVSAVATRWRFGHAGRFSVAYRLRFGQSPSVTLRA